MKKVFIVRLSEDGVCNEVFTNVKALYNYIVSQTTYKPQVIGFGCKDDLKFSYTNLVKELKNKSWGCSIYCDDSSIEIIGAVITSK